MNYLYILVAPSAVGKSELLNKLNNEFNNGKPLWERVNKYSTRDCRGIDKVSGYPDDVIDIDSCNEELRVASIAFKKLKENNISNNSKEYREAYEELFLARLNYIKEHCENNDVIQKGVVYFMNNNIYGINAEEIREGLKKNNLAVIISDFRAIKLLKEIKGLQNRIKVVYIASSMDERELLKRYKNRMGESEVPYNITNEGMEEINKLNLIIQGACELKYYEKIEDTVPILTEKWNSMLSYYSTIRARAMNIRMLYNRYIDNIALIDYVILNFYDLEYMFVQMRNIVYFNNDSNSNLSRLVRNPVFMVCAAPSSGKGTLMEIVGDIGKIDGSIVQITKYAKRKANEITDRRDKMQPIGDDGEFSDFIDGEIWEWIGHKENTNSNCINTNKQRTYAIDLSEVRQNIEKHKTQIFVANFDEITKFRECFPDNAVVLYLHATHQSETEKHLYTKRSNEILNAIKESYSLNEDSKEELQNIFLQPEYQQKLEELVNADKDEIEAIHKKYLKFNTLIDHVLLNTGTQADLVEQMLNLIGKYR